MCSPLELQFRLYYQCIITDVIILQLLNDLKEKWRNEEAGVVAA